MAEFDIRNLYIVEGIKLTGQMMFSKRFLQFGSGVEVNILVDSTWRMELLALEKVAGILMSRECLK